MVKSTLPNDYLKAVAKYGGYATMSGHIDALIGMLEMLWDNLKLWNYIDHETKEHPKIELTQIGSEEIDDILAAGYIVYVEDGNDAEFKLVKLTDEAGEKKAIYDRVTKELSVAIDFITRQSNELSQALGTFLESYEKAATDYDRDALYRLFEALPSSFEDYAISDVEQDEAHFATTVWRKQDGSR